MTFHGILAWWMLTLIGITATTVYFASKLNIGFQPAKADQSVICEGHPTIRTKISRLIRSKLIPERTGFGLEARRIQLELQRRLSIIYGFDEETVIMVLVDPTKFSGILDDSALRAIKVVKSITVKPSLETLIEAITLIQEVGEPG